MPHVANRWCCLTQKHLPRGSEDFRDHSNHCRRGHADMAFLHKGMGTNLLATTITIIITQELFQYQKGRKTKISTVLEMQYISSTTKLCGSFYFTSGQWKLDPRPARAQEWPSGTPVLAKDSRNWWSLYSPSSNFCKNLLQIVNTCVPRAR